MWRNISTKHCLAHIHFCCSNLCFNCLIVCSGKGLGFESNGAIVGGERGEDIADSTNGTLPAYPPTTFGADANGFVVAAASILTAGGTAAGSGAAACACDGVIEGGQWQILHVAVQQRRRQEREQEQEQHPLRQRAQNPSYRSHYHSMAEARQSIPEPHLHSIP